MIKIVIADDQLLFRDLLAKMLSESGDIQVAACAKDGNEAIAQIREHQPDLVLMDVAMPECNGVEAIRKLKQEKIPTKVLVLSGSNGDLDVYEAIRLGAEGYVPKTISREELVLAIRSVVSGMEVIHEAVRSLAGYGAKKAVTRRGSKILAMVEGFEVELAERDIEILKMIVDGMSTGEMSEKLFLAEGRIRNIITELISKLMVRDRTQLAVFAIKNNLVS